MISVYFSVCCLIFLVIISYFYYSKSRLNNVDNRLFSILLITNLIGIIIDVVGYLFFQVFPLDSIINKLIAKVYLIYYLCYTFTLLLYIYNVSFKNLFKIISKVLIGFIVICLIVFILPINIHPTFTTGSAVSFAYFWGFIFIATMIYCLVKNKKNILSKVYVPLYAFIFLTLLTVIIQKINPEITILLLSNTIVTLLMFFTIENPDIKVLEEVAKIKDITVKTNEDKSTFLYHITDEVNLVLNEIDNRINNMIEINKDKDIEAELKNVKNIISGAKSRVKSTIDVSNMDSKELKLINTKYNITNLINEIALRTKSKVKDGIDFRLNIASSIPSELYGDSIKIKQIILSLLDNSIKYTEKGFIELRVSSIIKYDICRLIISIEDSGKGIDLFKQSEILSNHEDLDKDEILNKDNYDLNIKTVKKLISIIGGTLSIESLNSNGTTINVTLDQKMVKSDLGIIENEIKKYDNFINSKKRVAVISQNKKTINIIKTLSGKLKYSFEQYNVTLDCLNKIRDNYKFDIIVIDEEMDKIDARSFLKKVKDVKTFNGKIYVVTNKKDIDIKKNLIEEGFDAVLVNPLSLKEIKNNF